MRGGWWAGSGAPVLECGAVRVGAVSSTHVRAKDTQEEPQDVGARCVGEHPSSAQASCNREALLFCCRAPGGCDLSSPVPGSRRENSCVEHRQPQHTARCTHHTPLLELRCPQHGHLLACSPRRLPPHDGHLPRRSGSRPGALPLAAALLRRDCAPAAAGQGETQCQPRLLLREPHVLCVRWGAEACRE